MKSFLFRTSKNRQKLFPLSLPPACVPVPELEAGPVGTNNFIITSSLANLVTVKTIYNPNKKCVVQGFFGVTNIYGRHRRGLGTSKVGNQCCSR